MEKIKVGVVGVGHLGKEHARVYSQMAAANLIGVADVDEEAGRAVAKRCNTKFFPDWRDLMGEVNAVSVVTPTIHHRAVAGPFLEAGVAVMVEKPMTATLEDADVLVRLAETNGVVLQVGHIERFNPVITAFEKHRITPLFIECHRLAPYTFRSSDVGVVLDLMIHDIDIIRSLVKAPIKRIDAVGVPVVSKDKEDIANARLLFDTGCVANVTASRVSIKKMRKIRLFGPDCYISLDYLERKGILYKTSPKIHEALDQMAGKGKLSLWDLRKVDFKDMLAIENMRIDEYEPLAMELESFVDCAREGKSPVVSGAEGREALKTAFEILAGIKESQMFLERRRNNGKQSEEA